MKRSLFAVAAAAAALSAQAQVVYSNNFDSAPVTALGANAAFSSGTGAITASGGGWNATYGNILRGDGNTLSSGFTLTLTNLPTHTGVDVGFLMAFLNSWDSTNGSPAPDYFELWIDGTLKAQYTYNNASGNVTNIGGGSLVAPYSQFDDIQFFSDTIADMSGDPALAFAHSGSTLTVQWKAGGAGWQFLGDEGYAIDNVSVELTGVVPEPSTYALMALGLAGVGAMARRRRAS